MKLFGGILLVVFLLMTVVHRSHQEEVGPRQHHSDKVHILNIEELVSNNSSRQPAQVYKWVIDSSRVQLVSKAPGRRIASVKNKTNGFTATLFETSGSFSTDFIYLANGLNELELKFSSAKNEEVSSIWLDSK